MTSRSLIVAALFAPAIAFAQSTPRPAGVAAEVRMLEQRMWDKWKTRDFEAMARMMAADARFLGTGGDLTKEQSMAEVRKSSCDVRRVTLQDVHVLVPGPNTAVITYRSVLDGTCNGKPVSPTGDLNTSVWERRGGRWLTIVHHQSPIVR